MILETNSERNYIVHHLIGHISNFTWRSVVALVYSETCTQTSDCVNTACTSGSFLACSHSARQCTCYSHNTHGICKLQYRFIHYYVTACLDWLLCKRPNLREVYRSTSISRTIYSRSGPTYNTYHNLCRWKVIWRSCHPGLTSIPPSQSACQILVYSIFINVTNLYAIPGQIRYMKSTYAHAWIYNGHYQMRSI